VTDSFPRQNARTQRFTLGTPRNFSITADGAFVIFLRSREAEDSRTCLWSIEIATGTEELLADPILILGDSDENLPSSEKIRRERARESASGILNYSADASGRKFVFALAGDLYITELGQIEPSRIEANPGVYDPRISPDGKKVAYIIGSEFYVISGIDLEATESSISENDQDISWGTAEFVAAEEMRRERGYWWLPDSSGLIVARVDHADVQKWYISDPANPDREPVVVRYPSAGTPNADIDLYKVTIDCHKTLIDINKNKYPYVVDVQCNLGEPVTVVAQTRNQKTLVVITVDVNTQESQIEAELTDPFWVEIVPGVPRWHNKKLLTVSEFEGMRSLMLDGELISDTSHWVREVLEADSQGVTYSASVEPSEVCLYRVSETGVEKLSPSGHVATAKMRAGTTVLVQASIEKATTYSVVANNKKLSIHSYASEPVVNPKVTFLKCGPREIEAAVLFPSEPLSHPLPILMDPYGGPHAQRVMKARNMFLSSQWLADQGFCVVVADGRGTPGRGQNWERSIYGDLAQPVLDDQVEVLQNVVDRYGSAVDENNVGIRGWSFGGYLAALAVLRRPDKFHAAIAGAPVTDWALYDTHYTERYLGTPSDNPENFERTSLIRDAHRLERPLLIIHGLADDNVIAAHSLQLSSALLAAGRQHSLLPLSGVTHMTPQEEVAENLLLLQVDFLKQNLTRG